MITKEKELKQPMGQYQAVLYLQIQGPRRKDREDGAENVSDKIVVGTGNTAQWLRTYTALTDDPSAGTRKTLNIQTLKHSI